MLPFIPGRSIIVRPLVALVVLVLALDGGTYSLVSRHSVAVALWWLILLGLVIGFWRPARLSSSALATAGFLALFAAWTFASIAWAASAEKAVLEGDRALLFLGVFAVVAAAARHRDVEAWCDGLAIGLVGVTLISLASRFFPDLLSDPDLILFLPEARGRLAFPVDYWNGLGILLALAVPLLLRGAVAGRGPAIQGLALAPLPATAAAIYLTSSRGGTLVALFGAGTFVLLTNRRWAAVGAVALAAAASAAAVAVLEARPALANAIGEAPAEEGPAGAALIALACAACGIAYALVARYVDVRVPAKVGRIAAAFAVAVSVVTVVSADPGRRFDAFRRTPPEGEPLREGFVTAHLLSGGGGGRWQFWGAALDEFEEHPIVGGGAGSYEAWWAEHGSFSYFIRDAHSIYLETLAELGIVGLLLLVAAFTIAVAPAARLLRRTRQRSTVAALLATFLAYALAAGFDWMWQLTVVSIVGVACLALLTTTARPAKPGRELRRATWLTAVLAAVLVCAEALPLVSQFELQASQAAFRRGDASAALAHVDSAHKLQPWAASPYVQLALVEEEKGRLAQARRAINEALERDPSDWRVWLIAARIDTRAGRPGAARRSARRAIELNPRSPLIRSNGG